MERCLPGAAGTLFLAGLLSLAGCGGSGESSGREGAAAERGGDGPAERNTPANQRAASVTAAETIRSVADGFRENRPLAVWNALPPPHRQDVNGLLRNFGERMDPELWDRLRTSAGKLADLLRQRREWILKYPPLRDDPAFASGPARQILSNWDVAVGLLEALAATDLETLRGFDGERVLAAFDADDLARLRHLAVLLPDDNPYSLLRELIEGADVREVSRSDDRARVAITPDDDEPREFEMVRLSGCWFPAAWHGTWESELAAARQKVEAELAPDVLARKREQLLPGLAAFENSVDRLLMAADAQAFHDLLDREVLPAISGAATLPPAENSATRHEPLPAGAGRVVVQFSKTLDERTEEAVAQALIGLADRPDAIVLPVPGGRGTSLEVSPIVDIAAFARRIRFGRVTKVNPAARTVDVEFAEH